MKALDSQFNWEFPARAPLLSLARVWEQLWESSKSAKLSGKVTASKQIESQFHSPVTHKNSDDLRKLFTSLN
ncbi:hypothetical protein CDAR_179511 [Caerostris darwini]|uniref:Uncharacterized protein n=1 Tax=Caerostris darwini TaxID=1538125 RepID=A0AAV4P1V4_9ARAC|nr:hypothetical protein CDAR_179511 [Caerostris darwini]